MGLHAAAVAAGTVLVVTKHAPAVQAIIDQAAAADGLTFMLAQAAWSQSDPTASTHLPAMFAVARAGIGDPTLRAAMDSAEDDVEAALSRQRARGDEWGEGRRHVPDREVDLAGWVAAALWAAAIAALADHALHALAPGQRSDLAGPWARAVAVRRDIAGLGVAAEQVATALLRIGLVHPVEALPATVIGLLG